MKLTLLLLVFGLVATIVLVTPAEAQTNPDLFRVLQNEVKQLKGKLEQLTADAKFGAGKQAEFAIEIEKTIDMVQRSLNKINREIREGNVLPTPDQTNSDLFRVLQNEVRQLKGKLVQLTADAKFGAGKLAEFAVEMETTIDMVQRNLNKINREIREGNA